MSELHRMRCEHFEHHLLVVREERLIEQEHKSCLFMNSHAGGLHISSLLAFNLHYLCYPNMNILTLRIYTHILIKLIKIVFECYQEYVVVVSLPGSVVGGHGGNGGLVVGGRVVGGSVVT